jgi:hypothetical protein
MHSTVWVSVLDVYNPIDLAGTAAHWNEEERMPVESVASWVLAR